MPAGFKFLQTFPLHMLYHLTIYIMKIFNIDEAKNVSTNLWTHQWRSRQDMFDVSFLLAAGCSANGVKMKASNIFNDSVKCGVIIDLEFCVKDLVKYYYEKSVNSNFTIEMKLPSTFGSVVIFVSV